MSLSRFAAAFVLVAACTSTDDGDAIDDSFLADGKADGSISEGSPEALGVLAVANTLTQPQLDSDVGLDSRAAKAMVKHRDGADATAGTADDDKFDTLKELDDVPYVGKTAFAKLLAYAQAHGFVTADTTWHLENPSPDDKVRTAVWSLAENDTWAVGGTGLVEHWDGSAWHDVASGYTGTLVNVWAAAADDVWMVGEAGTILHYDGSTITRRDAGTTRNLYSVRGTGPNDVWIVGDNDANAFYGLVLHWDGSAFKVLHPTDCPNTLYTVNAKSPTDVWVGGAVKTVCHWDGANWSDAMIADGDNQESVTDLWENSAGTLWAAYGGNIWKREGTAWSFVYSLPRTLGFLIPTLGRFAPVADNNIYAAGGQGYIAHYNGTAWSQTQLAGNAEYSGIAASGSSGWAVGNAARARLDGGSWTETYNVVSRQWLWSTSGASSDDLWSLGSFGDLVHHTATGWSAVTSPLGENDNTQALYAAASDDLWVFGAYQSAHWDGHTFTLHPELRYMRDAWGTGANNVWAVGEEGKVAHYDGTAWTPVDVGLGFGSYLFSVAGTGPNDIWASGTGKVLHYDGTAWTNVYQETDPNQQTSWSNVVAIAPNDVWVTGESKTALHWDGTTWSPIAITTSDRPWLRSGWAAASNDVWFVESDNALVHWNGSAFERTAMPGVATVIGFPGKGMWATGSDGWIRRRGL